MIKKYKVEMEAIKWTGHNTQEIFEWVGNDKVEVMINFWGYSYALKISTLRGDLIAKKGDFIAKIKESNCFMVVDFLKGGENE